METDAERRPWYSVSMRVIAIVAATVALYADVFVDGQSWIRQRREYLTLPGVREHRASLNEQPLAPQLLPLFGERGVYQLEITESPSTSLDEARRLFPE